MIKNLSKIKLISISELAREIGLIDKKNLKPQTHTLRFWEKNFSQIKPTILNGKRRFYGEKEIKIIKLIKYLLKDQGLTIKGAKLFLKNKTNKLDDFESSSIRTNYFKLNLKKKSINLLKKIKEIKKRNG